MNTILTPDEIKAIRKSFNLSASKAGIVFGGGRGAFAKFEDGSRKPSTSTNTLLLMARDNPRLFWNSLEEKHKRAKPDSESPFEVKPEQLLDISPEQQIALTRKLLVAEVIAHNIPIGSVHVTENPNIPDEGEDARVSWTGGCAATPFLSSRDCVFQLKAKEVSPKEIADEVVTKQGTIRPRLREVLMNGGTYIVLCTKSYSQPLIDKRKTSILEKLRESGLVVSHEQVEFWTCFRTSEWINRFPSVAIWYLNETGSPIAKNFRTWDWAYKLCNPSSIQFIHDTRFDDLQQELAVLKHDGKSVHIKGQAGIGKSRLILESFSHHGVLSEFRELVTYASVRTLSPEELILTVEKLSFSSLRAVVIVEGFAPSVNRHLLSHVQLPESNLKLIAIEDCREHDASVNGVVHIPTASLSFTEKLVKALCDDIYLADQQQLAKLSSGYPKITWLICDSWKRSGSISEANAIDIVNQFVFGSDEVVPDDSPLIKTARIVAVCGGIRAWEEKNFEESLTTIDSTLPLRQFRESVISLMHRGVIKKYGPDITIEPKVLALPLAERQWELWEFDRRRQVLFGNLSGDLKKGICKQLSLLNYTKVAKQIVQQLFVTGAHAQNPDFFQCLKKHTPLLYSLVHIDAITVVTAIEQLVDHEIARVEHPYFGGDIFEALKTAAYPKNSYEESTKVLLKVAAHSRSESALEDLKELHSLFGSEANADLRLRLLKSLSATNDTEERKVLHRLLESIITDSVHSRFIGPEKHGVREAYKSWTPKTKTDIREYVEGAVQVLINLASVEDSVGKEAISTLGDSLSHLFQLKSYNVAEQLVYKTDFGRKRCWSNAILAVQRELAFHSGDHHEQDLRRIEDMLAKLLPQTTSERLNHFLHGVFIDREILLRGEYEEQVNEEIKQLRSLVQEVVADTKLLDEHLSSLSKSTVSGILVFGKELATHIEDPVRWLTRIKNEMVQLFPENRAFDFLLGFLSGLAESHPVMVREFKQESAHSNVFAPLLPRLCVNLGIEHSDISVVIDAIERGNLDAQKVTSWAVRGIFDEKLFTDLLRLLNYLPITGQKGYVVAVEIFALNQPIFSNRPKERLELSLNFARLFNKWPRAFTTSGVYFSSVMLKTLDLGSQNPNARRLATVLSQAIIKAMTEHRIGEVHNLAHKLFQDFPAEVLSAIKQEVQRKSSNTLLEYRLSDPPTSPSGEPWISTFPIEMLLDWCHQDEVVATQFLGSTMPFLARCESDEELKLHTDLRRLIDEFGSCQNLWEGIQTNLGRYVWRDSREPFVRRYLEPINDLFEHECSEVRSNARKLHADILVDAENAKFEDEQRAGRERF